MRIYEVSVCNWQGHHKYTWLIQSKTISDALAKAEHSRKELGDQSLITHCIKYLGELLD